MDDVPMTPERKAQAAAEELARAIMDLTEASGAPRAVVGAALNRALAGFWARFTVDRGDSPEAAEAAVHRVTQGTAELAADLVRAHRGRKDDA